MNARSAPHQYGAPASVFSLCLLLFAIVVDKGQAETTVLDLSYRHHVDAKTLSDVIQARSPAASSSILQQQDVFELDISSSLLGDKSLENVLAALSSRSNDGNHVEGAGGGSLHLTARTNQLTPKGVTHLIKTLIVDQNAANVTTDKATSSPHYYPTLSLTSLDLGWNHLHPESPGQQGFLKALQLLVENNNQAPRCLNELRLDRCGLGPSGCRSIGKGVINRYKNHTKNMAPLSLYLCGNPVTGDAGAAALAAAIRSVSTAQGNEACLVFDTLDLSACGIGDAGAEALALAIEDAPGCCIKHLDLSNNHITDQGAGALGRALTAGGNDRGSPGLFHLDLSNNKDVGDRGVTAIAEAVEKGKLPSVSLRSCHIHADGATCFGKALRTLALNKKAVNHKVSVDLSGNPLGILRGKSKKDGDKYSASRLKSKASATAASYMNLFKKSVTPILAGTSSVESDDDEEKLAGEFGDPVDEAFDPAALRCGAKALASGFLEDENDKGGKTVSQKSTPASGDHFHLAVRRCFFDHGGADALAAILVAAKDDLGIDLRLDVDLNPVLEDDMLSALHGDAYNEDLLREMAERHMDAIEVLRESRERASEAARAAATRMDAWDAPRGFEDEEFWDSDADYDDEDESYN